MRNLHLMAVVALCGGVVNAATINVPADQPPTAPQALYPPDASGLPLFVTDINGSCGVDISDLVYFVDYMFAGGPAPLVGCE